LNGVGILKFIDQNMSKALLIVLKNMRLFQPEFMSPQQQFSKIHHTAALTECFIVSINIQHKFSTVKISRIQLSGSHPIVFTVINKPLQFTRRMLLFINADFFHNTLEQAQLIITVNNLKIFHQSGIFPVCTQQTMRQPMESAHPHITQWSFQQVLNTKAHFSCRFIGESDRHNTIS